MRQVNYNKIHIYLRMYSRNRNNPDRPTWFNYEKVFRNLLLTADPRFCEVTVCFEKEEDYDSHFIKTGQYYDKYKFNLEFIKTPVQRKTFFNESWSHSLAASSEVVERDISLGKIGDDHLIYIIEDDYLHHPFWPQMSLDFFNGPLRQFDDENDVVCLYDHYDKYLFVSPTAKDHWGMYHDLQSRILVSSCRHWRQLPNCGLSMMMSKGIWERDKFMWLGGYSDCEIGHQITKNHGARIWSPMPALSTHCVKPFVAPLVDWGKIIELHA